VSNLTALRDNLYEGKFMLVIPKCRKLLENPDLTTNEAILYNQCLIYSYFKRKQNKSALTTAEAVFNGLSQSQKYEQDP